MATSYGRDATEVRSSLPILPIFAPWAHGSIIQARIVSPQHDRSEADARLTLGIIASCEAWEQALDLCVDMADHVGNIIVVLDTADVTLATNLESTLRSALCNKADGMRQRVVAHPLRNDFATQRNCIQRQASTEWVLQLDCDERLTNLTKTALPSILDKAKREGWDAIAFSRRNLVDGIVSALYPDVQYRLLRRTVRFTRAVHEYPQLGANHQSFFYLGAEIVHSLASERLERRGTWYEEIQDGAGRPSDTMLLRRPLESTVRLARG